MMMMMMNPSKKMNRQLGKRTEVKSGRVFEEGLCGARRRTSYVIPSTLIYVCAIQRVTKNNMRSVLAIVKLLFHDKRLTLIVLVVWMTSTCIIFNQLGAFHSQFMTFGPSPKTEFMAMKIDSWCKWWALASFSFFNTAINEFIASALCPWFTNTIQDQKTKYLDHPKSTCMGISLIYDFYTHVMSIFGLYLMFSQVISVLKKLSSL